MFVILTPNAKNRGPFQVAWGVRQPPTHTSGRGQHTQVGGVNAHKWAGLTHTSGRGFKYPAVEFLASYAHQHYEHDTGKKRLLRVDAVIWDQVWSTIIVRGHGRGQRMLAAFACISWVMGQPNQNESRRTLSALGEHQHQKGSTGRPSRQKNKITAGAK